MVEITRYFAYFSTFIGFLTAFILRGIRHGYCPPDINLIDIIDTADDRPNLFQQVLNDSNYHVLAPLQAKTT